MGRMLSRRRRWFNAAATDPRKHGTRHEECRPAANGCTRKRIRLQRCETRALQPRTMKHAAAAWSARSRIRPEARTVSCPVS